MIIAMMLALSAARADCAAYFSDLADDAVAEAAAWCSAGETFTFDGLEIFYTCQGDPSDDFVYLNHGWPTSSFDFAAIMSRLSEDFYVCALDTPGYGFSDKPAHGYTYSIFDDAELVEHFFTDVVSQDEVILVTHDKGDSVGLEVLYRYQASAAPGYTLTHHVILNGSLSLELANITGFQDALLSPVTGPPLAAFLNGPLMSSAVSGLYSPTLDTVEQAELAAIFDYLDGTDVLDQTIDYLDERALYEETRWMAALADSDVPTVLIWGEEDTVAVTDVADYVWCEGLAHRARQAEYWRLPTANHYVQRDRPDEVSAIIEGFVRGERPDLDEDDAYLLAPRIGRPLCD